MEIISLISMDKEPIFVEQRKKASLTKVLKFKEILHGCYALPAKQTEVIPLLSISHFVVAFYSLLERKKKEICFNECLLCC